MPSHQVIQSEHDRRRRPRSSSPRCETSCQCQSKSKSTLNTIGTQRQIQITRRNGRNFPAFSLYSTLPTPPSSYSAFLSLPKRLHSFMMSGTADIVWLVVKEDADVWSGLWDSRR